MLQIFLCFPAVDTFLSVDHQVLEWAEDRDPRQVDRLAQLCPGLVLNLARGVKSVSSVDHVEHYELLVEHKVALYELVLPCCQFHRVCDLR